MPVHVETSGVVLELRNLRSRIETQRGPVFPVNDVSSSAIAAGPSPSSASPAPASR